MFNTGDYLVFLGLAVILVVWFIRFIVRTLRYEHGDIETKRNRIAILGVLVGIALMVIGYIAGATVFLRFFFWRYWRYPYMW